MKVKEIIVVEGKNDTNKLLQCVECDTIETSGTHLSKQKIKLLKQLQQTRGIIVFTDPDYPGNKIRSLINEQIPGVKHAFIQREKAKTSRKVGIEHANKEDIIEALQHVLTYEEQFTQSISLQDLMELGMSGNSNSAKLREQVGNALFIGKCNVKTLWKRLNLLQINRQQLHALLEEIYEADHCNTK